jgi:hypothetical protein
METTMFQWFSETGLYINVLGGALVIKVTNLALVVYPAAFYGIRWLYRRYRKT